MKIVYLNQKWRIADMMYALDMSFNNNYRDKQESYDLEVNQDILSDLNELSKTLDKNKKSLKLFCDKDNTFRILPCIFERLLNVDSVDEIESFLSNMSIDEVKFRVIATLYTETYEDQEYVKKHQIEELLSDNIKLFKFINKLNTESDLKLMLYEFMISSEQYLQEFLEVINIFIPKYKDIIKKYEEKIKVFNTKMENNLNEKGVEFLRHIKKDIIDIKSYKKVYIIPSIFNMGIDYSIYDKDILLNIGFSCEKFINKRNDKEILEEKLIILKILSDPIKYKILNYLKHKDLYGKEIGEKINLSKNTVSYHMNHLICMNLVNIKKTGRKIYYTLNKDNLNEALNYIKQQFQ
ncbi:ArsR/SmtB family transcription factor [Oceanirhabdus sp. W0125-5]|uniref:ArsR/SmtB family transcription factor n=1 Tax=Oceanirhabdus sp. W0125-5 TaxID=2999116 RepID=UPI0022F3102E|nr:ArsR family transcriptional regulator [Oceanirhabdus sp. W0125-5]WBW97570.1 ArsR family transcriptional regulator [Oceanirhabdus sp. W0125-5]